MEILYVLTINHSSNPSKIIMERKVVGRIVPRFLPVWVEKSWDEMSLARNIPIPLNTVLHITGTGLMETNVPVVIPSTIMTS